jgi:hypothetical protein
MDPERRNQRILIGLTWLVTGLGAAAAGIACFDSELSRVSTLEGEKALLAFLFPAVAVCLGLVVCLERPRSGAKPKAHVAAIVPTLLSLLLLVGIAVVWFTQPKG